MHYEEYSNVERTRLASLLRESVLTLCRNGIAAGPCVVRVDGLIGVTLEDQRVVLVSIQESFSVVSGEPGSTSDLQGESSSDVLVHRSDLVDAATDPNVIQSHLPPGAFDADRMREQPSADMQTSHRMRVNSRASTTDLTNQRQLTSNFQKVHCCDEQVVQEMSRQPLGKPLADVRTMTGATTHSEGSGVAMEDAAEKILMPTNDVFAANMKPEHSVGDPSLAREHSWISSMNEQLIGRLPAPDTNVEHMLDIVHSGVVSYDDRHQSSHFDGATFFPFDRARRQLMSGTKWYPCRLCSYRSNRSFNFIRHFVQRHSFGRMIQCADCGSVIRKNTFSAHWLQSHSSVGPRRLTAKPATQASASSAAASDDQWCTKVKSEIVTDEELADVVSIDSDHDVSV